ncbi:MAG: xanthine dehydrogenase family protein molybdopterin-binding subunit [Acidobacteriota bacterium]|nr:xanthine dehydrogenase family protein molybdopterin-binding subunit [Acidobacteriota bacterium]
MDDVWKIDRREFFKVTGMAGGGLMLGVYLPDRPWNPSADAPLQPNVFVRVDETGAVTIWVGKADMGQGVRTSLPMIVADELEADWSRVGVIQAEADPHKYGRQITVGSGSVRNGAWMPLRKAGATAREMLVRAAAERWKVPVASCRAESGYVSRNGSKQRLGYGKLADAASELPVPSDPRLKTPAEFRIIGTSPQQVDVHDKVCGRTQYGIDVRVPGMRFATVVHAPLFGASLTSVDDTRARRVAGVRDVVQIPTGVAVVADHTWAAFQGAKALDVQWSGGFAMSSADISAELRQAANRKAVAGRTDGDADAALATAAKRVEADYEAPYLAHATMEPMNCTAHVRADRAEVWAPTQNPQGTQGTTARLTGLKSEQVTVHVMHLGCGWGRRSRTDFVEDAVHLSKKLGQPVQVTWTREEDMRHDLYRPAAFVRFSGGLDAAGRLVALKARVVAQPLSATGRGKPGGVDDNAVDGIMNMRYAVPNFLVEYGMPDLGVPTGHWRSVGPSQNLFFFESFIDELAHAAGRDPFDFRHDLLADQPRQRRVLEVAGEKSGWGKPLPAGHARGLAIHENKGTVVAQVAEVSLEGGKVRVHHVWCTVDAGQVIHPGIVHQQMSGAVASGLTAALYQEITLADGHVVQGNFDTYKMMRIDEMPLVDVDIVKSGEAPGGVGEPGLPPIAPAVANALFALTGTRVRSLPLRPEALRGTKRA